jgi:glycerol transport system ATP-binding protein
LRIQLARIRLQDLAHSYHPNPSDDRDWALRGVDFVWDDGGAFALLGPSGCGKTTLLNLISGLLRPTKGRIVFDEQDVTMLEPRVRNIAQVFQFPVVYDTMTVYENLAFPLRNRGVQPEVVDRRVRSVASALGLDASLNNRARALTADAKQKISLGRGLVRQDVSAILFDEPLTVIDPHLKWRLRSELKALHQQSPFTMIYVTHDQTEALTFADQVVVMNEGEVIQIGTPAALFDRPNHTFVGHFIGSPGMNLLPVSVDQAGVVRFEGYAIQNSSRGSGENLAAKGLQIGVRPEFVRLQKEGIPVNLVRVIDAGHMRILEFRHGEHSIKMVLSESSAIPDRTPYFLGFEPNRAHLYADGWIVA